MFFGCSNLTNIDLSSFNINKATIVSYMFKGCSKLKEIKINKKYVDKIDNKIKEQNIKIKYI